MRKFSMLLLVAFIANFIAFGQNKNVSKSGTGGNTNQVVKVPVVDSKTGEVVGTKEVKKGVGAKKSKEVGKAKTIKVPVVDEKTGKVIGYKTLKS